MAYPLLRNRLGSAVAVAFVCAGCFTDPINMRPSVRIDTPTQATFRGEPIMYTATASDPDGDAVTLRWAQVQGDCPAPGAVAASDWQQVNVLKLQAKDTLKPYCALVWATDRYGAAAFDARPSNPTNRAPLVSLDVVMPTDPASYRPQTPFELSAANSRDPDGDVLVFEWSLKTPPSSKAVLEACKGPMMDTTRCLTPDAPGDYEVTVRATDPFMEATTASRTLHIQPGQLGVPQIDLVSPAGTGPYPIGSLFQVSGAHSTGDGPDLPGCNWTGFEPPPGSNAAPTVPCNDPASQCFTADVPGTYRIGLSVHDDAGDSQPIWASYVVAPDQPPCIEHTTPDFGTPMTTATRFVVDSVFDDLDPYPSIANMQWFVADPYPNAPFRPVASFPSFTLNTGSYAFGDTVSVRLEISDRVTDRSAKAFLACGDKDVCTATNVLHPDTCFQRVTWKVRILQP